MSTNALLALCGVVIVLAIIARVALNRSLRRTVVVSILKHAPDIDGRTLRETMADFGENMSGPAFYSMMSRLEDAQVVIGENDMHGVRHYRLR